MTCCKSIQSRIFLDHSYHPNPKQIIIESENGEIEMVLNSYPYGFFYLTIQVFRNYLVNDPNRFRIYNRTQNIYEDPIFYGYLLMKDMSYDVYDGDQKIISFDANTFVYFE